MDAITLKRSILQEAIQGKLVPQLAEDGVVEQLGEEPEEIPFEIPESWKWIQLKQLAVKISDGSHNPPPNTGSGIPVLSAKNVNNWNIDLSKTNRWTDLTNWNVENKKIPIEKGDVLLTIVGTIGRAAVVNFDEKIMLQRSVCVIKQKREILNNKFLVLALSTPLIQQWLNEKASGTAQQGVYLKTVKEIFIPLPPQKEQERIVKKVEEILPLVDEYGKAHDKLAELNASLPEKLKQSILQEAIQGKLVPQLAEEGAVEQLGEEPEEVPFDIPKSWKWECMETIVDVRDGTHDTPKYEATGIPFITSKNLRNGKIDFSTVKYINQNDHKAFSKRSNVEAGDILMAMIGTIGNALIVPDGLPKFSIKNIALLKKKHFSELNFKYLLIVIRALEGFMLVQASGSVQKFVSLTYLRKLPIPVPPLKEQTRIVKKVEELLAQVASLKI